MNILQQKVSFIFVVLSTVTALLFFEGTQGQYAISFAPTPQTPQNPGSQFPPPTSPPSSETQSETTSTQGTDLSELIYENTTAGVKVSYPLDWKYFGSYHDEFLDSIASFQGPVDKHGRPGIQIVSRSLEGDKNVAEYANTFFKNEEKNVEGYKIEQIITDGVTLSGKPAYKAVVTYNICIAEDCGGEEKRGKMLEVGTVNDNGKLIAINYDSYESEYPKYLGIAERMIDSLELR